LYCTCLLKPLTSRITKQDDEILDAKWMPLDEFLNLGYYKGVYKEILEVGKQGLDGKFDLWTPHELPVVFRNGNNILYHGFQSKL